MNLKLDHIAIQTNDFDNTISWYKDFLACEEKWYKKREELPVAIQNRMPYSSQLMELQTSEIRFHIFDIVVPFSEQSRKALQIEHYCLEVDTLDELHQLRSRWIELFQSGKYSFMRNDMVSEVIPSSHGMNGFYAHDPNGIELEIFHLPKN